MDKDLDLAENLALFAKNNLEENGVNNENIKIISFGSQKPLIKRDSSKENYRLEFIPLK